MLMNFNCIYKKSTLLAIAGMSLGLVSNAQAAWHQPLAEEGTVLPNAPGWLSRTDFRFSMHERQKDFYEVITIQPIWQSAPNNHTFFFQGRYAHQMNDNVLTGGGGYRFRTANDKHIFGVNAFYDYTTKHDHQRYTVGGEYFNRWITLRGNIFQRTSDFRYTKLENGAHKREGAVSGWNVTGDVPLPHMPWIRAVVTYSKWRMFNMPDGHGWQMWGDFDIHDNLQLHIGGKHNSGTNVARMFLKVNWLFGRNPEHEHTSKTHFITKNFWTDRNLEQHMLDKVIRSEKQLIEREATYWRQVMTAAEVDDYPMEMNGPGYEFIDE